MKQIKIKSLKEKPKYSKEYKNYLKKIRINKGVIITIQLTILIAIFVFWEVFAITGVIDSFIMSSPSKILNQIALLFNNGTLFYHIGITLNEAIIGFLIATLGGTLIAIILWWNKTLRKILDPYVVVLNSLPKIALGPILIIWIGAGTGAIIAMDVLIMIVITILSMLNAFNSCDESKILLLKSMGANKLQILCKLILPNSLLEFISVLKINVGLTWVGTIMGEYLVSRAGLGYLIVYGGQVFKLDLVMASTIILCILAAIMYFLIVLIEKFVEKKRNIH